MAERGTVRVTISRRGEQSQSFTVPNATVYEVAPIVEDKLNWMAEGREVSDEEREAADSVNSQLRRHRVGGER